jgi:hypothetical protein
MPPRSAADFAVAAVPVDPLPPDLGGADGEPQAAANSRETLATDKVATDRNVRTKSSRRV